MRKDSAFRQVLQGAFLVNKQQMPLPENEFPGATVFSSDPDNSAPFASAEVPASAAVDAVLMHGAQLASPPTASARNWRRLLYPPAKRCFDVLFSSIVLLLVAPLMPVIALLIRLDSGGPILFRQERVGRDGRLFTIYKFRTMTASAPKYAEAPVDDKSDHRVTRLGFLLRRTSLDELPQFYCVLKGDMSVVGPRPEMQFLVDNYSPPQRRRLDVRPGITGPWQISPARKFPIHEHLEYDFYYLDNQSFWLDMQLIAETVLLVVRSLKASLSGKARQDLFDEPQFAGVSESSDMARRLAAEGRTPKPR